MGFQPALFASPSHTLRPNVRKTIPATYACPSTTTSYPLSMRETNVTSPLTPTISRRTFSTLLTALPLTLLPSPARAFDISALVIPYKDLPKGFTILRPNGWNEFEGLQDSYDIKWQDVIQPLEFVTVLTSPLPKNKSLGDIGASEAVGKKLAGGRGGQLVNAVEKDIDGVPAYVFEIKRGPTHQLTLLTVNKQKLYSVNASCAEKRWRKREQLLRGVVDSFRPRL